MRYNSDIYDKVFPRKKDVEKVETVVESFTPTEDEQKKDDVNTNVKTEDNIPREDGVNDDGQHDSVDTE